MLIVVVLETKNKSGSDFYYLKSILQKFYKERGSGIKIQPVFMNGKGYYRNIEKNIKNFTKQYLGDNKTIYFCDIDSEDLEFNQQQLNKEIIEYCNSNGFEIVWFNKTIEDVLIGNTIAKNKSKIAEDYYIKNKIKDVNINNLNIETFNKITQHKSNVLSVLDKYLPRI